ncbi:hypothetical protein HU200_047065 [Digitaria exilis]|uniref:Peptidase A1 domain-containing protein n=1 Tax=Digitaria exilis TaxID=1010633 RepID=A0A835B045_9POAL|nr:hypothetical protein HU200_047065 [Digitaria exilis]
MQALITLLLLLTPLLISTAPPPSGYRFTLTHVDSKGGFTRSELMRRAAHRSRHRHRATTTMSSSGYYSTTSSSSDTRPSGLFSGQAEYLMELAIGTPPVPFVALADTGSDLTWTQCKPCKLCFAQDTPIYDPTTSSSFSLVTCANDTCLPIWRTNCTASSHCRYRYVYGDGAYSAGVLGTETLTFGSSSGDGSVTVVAGIAFGCGVDNGGLSYNSTGTVGLGRGTLSLVSQLGVGKFSYCLTDFFNTTITSPVLFGSLAELTDITAAQSTPLIQNLQSPSRYFVSLEGISLGDPGFRVVVDHVAGVLGQRTAVNVSSLESPCFPAPAGAQRLPEMPDMVFHFAGGADMRLRKENYMSFDEEDLAFCLNIAGTEPHPQFLIPFPLGAAAAPRAATPRGSQRTPNASPSAAPFPARWRPPLSGLPCSLSTLAARPLPVLPKCGREDSSHGLTNTTPPLVRCPAPHPLSNQQRLHRLLHLPLLSSPFSLSLSGLIQGLQPFAGLSDPAAGQHERSIQGHIFPISF